jgi:hypothetical protein
MNATERKPSNNRPRVTSELPFQKPTSEGWIRLYRKIIDSAVFQDAGLFKLWILSLLRANHRDNWVKIDGLLKPIEVKRGQFITGRFSLHDAFYPKKSETDKSPYTIWRWLETLQSLGYLHIKTSNKFTLITIVNYEKYQSDVSENAQQNEQQVSSRRAAGEQHVSTNKNDKNSGRMLKRSIRTDDHKNNSDEKELWEEVRILANQVKKKILPNKGTPLEDQDRQLILVASYLSRTQFCENWLQDSLQAVIKASKKPKNPIAYFRTCLIENTKALGKNFHALEQKVKIPQELLKVKP